MREIKAAFADIRDARINLAEVLQRVIKEGDLIRYDFGGKHVCARVRYVCDDRVAVETKNKKSRRGYYFVYAYRIEKNLSRTSTP